MGGVGDGKVMGGIGEKSRGAGVFLPAALWVLGLFSCWSGRVLFLAVCLRCWPFLAFLVVY
jgi:hypothetical protein